MASLHLNALDTSFAKPTHPTWCRSPLALRLRVATHPSLRFHCIPFNARVVPITSNSLAHKTPTFPWPWRQFSILDLRRIFTHRRHTHKSIAFFSLSVFFFCFFFRYCYCYCPVIVVIRPIRYSNATNNAAMYACMCKIVHNLCMEIFIDGHLPFCDATYCIHCTLILISGLVLRVLFANF